MHEDFVFNTAGSKCSQFRAFVRAVAFNCLDQPDGADGDEVFHVFAGVVEFFDYMGNKPQIVFNQQISRFGVSLGHHS
ncbi:hypothetical protein D3C74_438690 [compost metagenome]